MKVLIELGMIIEQGGICPVCSARANDLVYEDDRLTTNVQCENGHVWSPLYVISSPD